MTRPTIPTWRTSFTPGRRSVRKSALAFWRWSALPAEAPKNASGEIRHDVEEMPEGPEAARMHQRTPATRRRPCTGKRAALDDGGEIALLAYVPHVVATGSSGHTADAPRPRLTCDWGRGKRLPRFGADAEGSHNSRRGSTRKNGRLDHLWPPPCRGAGSKLGPLATRSVERDRRPPSDLRRHDVIPLDRLAENAEYAFIPTHRRVQWASMPEVTVDHSWRLYRRTFSPLAGRRRKPRPRAGVFLSG